MKATMLLMGLAGLMISSCSAGKGVTPLSKEEILRISHAVARERGYFPEAPGLWSYDEGNPEWLKSYGGRTPPWLEGHDYQVVEYRRPYGVLDGGLLVIVDRNTGELLMVRKN